MDLIDVLRIAAHRWYVVMVILLIGTTAAIVLASSVAPTYKVEAQAILISGQEPVSPVQPKEFTNPYQAFTGSLYPTLSAVTRTVDGQEYRDLLAEEGSEKDFELSTSQEAPVIITESTAASPQEATELSQQVQSALSTTLVALQSDAGVPVEQQIVMRELTTSKPEEEMGNRNRVLFGILGLTFAAAIGGAVLVESIIQMRNRSRKEDPNDTATAPSAGAGAKQNAETEQSAGTKQGAGAKQGAGTKEKSRGATGRKVTAKKFASGQRAKDSADSPTGVGS